MNKGDRMKKNKNLPKMVATKKKKQEVAPPIATTDEMKKLIGIIAIITIIFLVVYGLTVVLTKDKSEKSEETEVKIQDEDILLGNLLEQDEDNYFVLVTVADDDYTQIYNVYINSSRQKEDGSTIYTGNLSNSFNLKYKADETNANITSINDLKLKGSALLHITNKRIVNVYEGKDAIVAQLKNL